MLAPLSDDDPRTIGPFAIESRLGAGAMGRVYLGRTATGMVAAIKLVRAELADDAGFRRRFRQEVDAVGRVVGPHTAALVGADTEADRPWLATEYLPGLSLRDVVAQRGPLPTAEVLRLATGIAAALTAIHAAGVVHRDLKPGNVILLPDGPGVIDFGIARAADATALTATGVTIGTPPFLSPEQIDGDEVGPAADVFALGGLLTYLATGRTPFGDGNTGVILHRITHGEPKLGGIEEPLLSLIRSCLAKDPALRPTPVRLAAPEAGTTAMPHPTAVPARRPRRRMSLALGATGVLAAAAVFVPIAIGRQTVGTPVAADQECVGGASIATAGTSLANTAMSAVGDAYTVACPGKSVAYQPFGTDAAIGDLASGAVTVAIVDRPLTDGERSSAGCEVREVPYLALPVVLPFHVTGVDELTLDAGTLGDVFGGRITRWNDDAISELNPGVPLPATAITPVRLGEDEPTTEVFRSFAGDAGRDGEVVESDAAVRAEVNGIEGAIGYAAATAHAPGPFVALGGADPTVESVAAAVADTLGADRQDVPPYPLVSLTYAVACADDGQATEFLLAGLGAQGDATDFVLPAGEWADQVRAGLQ